tara:strand:+ start:5029 stop:5994 length:966 start_codon:yes stop_codon:yes gene_type:complete
MVNFRNFDLNLLRVLEAMLTLSNTTRAGEAVGLSQPAVSAALRRLRELTGDQLFVREGNVLAPTPYALSLRRPVGAALESLERALSGGPDFDPATSRRAFLIGASDYFNEMLMPGLADRVTREAPNMRLKMLPAMTGALPSMLSGEGYDLIVSIAIEAPDWIESRRAFRASNVAVARRGHPMLSGLKPGATMPLELFCGLPQVIFSVTPGFEHFEDAALAAIGRSRHVRVAVPGYFGVGRVAAQSDLIGVLPARFAHSVAGDIGLSAYRLPLDMPLIELRLYWRRRDSDDKEHLWLRTQVEALLEPLDEETHPLSGAAPWL